MSRLPKAIAAAVTHASRERWAKAGAVEAAYRKAVRDGWAGELQSIADVHAATLGYWFDTETANYHVKFFETFLRLPIGPRAGQPFVLMPWQREVVRALFGWKDKAGKRRFHEAYIEIPKKNGKSVWTAGLALDLLVLTDLPATEVYSAATARDQAAKVFREAARMLRQSPELRSRLTPVPSRNTIAYHAKDSFFKALSADVPVSEGLDAAGVIVDELHAHRNRDLYDALRYAGLGRNDPLVVVTTTAGEEHTSVCFELHQLASDVAAGTVLSPRFFGRIYAAAPGDDIDDRRVWYKANPALGVTLAEERFASDLENARRSPATLARFKRYRLNIWGEGVAAYIPRTAWDACYEPDFDDRDLLGRPAYLAIDISAQIDLTAATLLFPPQEDGEPYRVRTRFFMPGERVEERVKNDRVQYDDWIKAGWMVATPTPRTDYTVLIDAAVEFGERYKILDVAVDPWQGAQLMQVLQDEHGFECVEYRQGYKSMTAPTKLLEALVFGRELLHDGNPVLAWNMANLIVDIDAADNRKPNKRKSREKVDGAVTVIMALGRTIVRPLEQPKRSVYSRQSRGFLSI